MYELEIYLKVFEDEIRVLINKEENPREFKLFRFDEIGKLTHIIQDIGKQNIEVIYNPEIIEAYYNPTNLNNNFIQKPNVTNEILISIFKYLAHHEYGHTFFCDSTLTLVRFFESNKDQLFMDYENQVRFSLKELFWKLFQILRDFYADSKAKQIQPILPKYYLDLYFRAIEQFLGFNRIITRTLRVIDFYSKVFYSSIWFYNFNQWDNLLKKCGDNDKTESLNLIFQLNKIFEALITKNLDLRGYKQFLTQLTIFLWEIDYDSLIFENEIEKKMLSRLKEFLRAL
jgi:hypothetical protein